MFKITKDAIYLFIIFWLLLIMTVEFHWFVGHYEYLDSIMQQTYKFQKKLHKLELDLIPRS